MMTQILKGLTMLLLIVLFAFATAVASAYSSNQTEVTPTLISDAR